MTVTVTVHILMQEMTGKERKKMEYHLVMVDVDVDEKVVFDPIWMVCEYGPSFWTVYFDLIVDDVQVVVVVVVVVAQEATMEEEAEAVVANWVGEEAVAEGGVVVVVAAVVAVPVTKYGC